MRLERTDHVILRELIGWTEGNFPRGTLNITLRELAERTGLHRNTVQRRVSAMRAGGVVDGFLYEPQPGLLGLVRAGHSFIGGDIVDREHLLRLLAPFPFVSIAMLHADSCFLHTWHTSEASVAEDVAALRDALGASDALEAFVSTRLPPHPSEQLRLTPLDRRILIALRRAPDRSIAPIARAVGASRRHVARRLERFIKAGAGALVPVFHARRIEGEVIAVYDADPERETITSLAKAFPFRIMGPTGAGVRPMVMVPVPNLGEAVRLRAEAAALPGLGSLRVSLLRDSAFPEACDAWLEAHVQTAPPPVVGA